MQTVMDMGVRSSDCNNIEALNVTLVILFCSVFIQGAY